MRSSIEARGAADRRAGDDVASRKVQRRTDRGLHRHESSHGRARKSTCLGDGRVDVYEPANSTERGASRSCATGGLAECERVRQLAVLRMNTVPGEYAPTGAVGDRHERRVMKSIGLIAGSSRPSLHDTGTLPHGCTRRARAWEQQGFLRGSSAAAAAVNRPARVPTTRGRTATASAARTSSASSVEEETVDRTSARAPSSPAVDNRAARQIAGRAVDQTASCRAARVELGAKRHSSLWKFERDHRTDTRRQRPES